VTEFADVDSILLNVDLCRLLLKETNLTPLPPSGHDRLSLSLQHPWSRVLELMETRAAHCPQLRSAQAHGVHGLSSISLHQGPLKLELRSSWPLLMASRAAIHFSLNSRHPWPLTTRTHGVHDHDPPELMVSMAATQLRGVHCCNQLKLKASMATQTQAHGIHCHLSSSL